MGCDEAAEDFWCDYMNSYFLELPHRNFHDIWRMYCMGGEL